MTSKQKAKGNRGEREVVDLAHSHGYRAERARGSDGRALGMSHEVDCVIYDVPLLGNMTIQVKRRKVIADYLAPPPGCMAVVVREDRSAPLVVMDFDKFLEMMKR